MFLVDKSRVASLPQLVTLIHVEQINLRQVKVNIIVVVYKDKFS